MEEAEKQEHTDQLARLRKENEELIDLSRRMKADLANFRKDEEKRVQQFAQFASRGILSKLFPILDSFDLALKHLPKELEQNSWAQGVKHTKQQIDGVLKDIGVTEISVAGVPFDPNIHEAVAEQESDDGQDGTVTEILQKGYALHGEVLRAAKVKINKKKEQ